MDHGGVADDDGPVAERKGGASLVVERPASLPYVLPAAAGGVIAAFVFLAYQLLVNTGLSVSGPFRLAASIVLGERAMAAGAPASTTVPVGLAVHVAIGLAWGTALGLVLMASRGRWAAGGLVTLAMVFGSVIWLLDFYVLAPLFWPWLHPLSSVRLFIGHVFLFGLPLGLWTASHSEG